MRVTHPCQAYKLSGIETRQDIDKDIVYSSIWSGTPGISLKNIRLGEKLTQVKHGASCLEHHRTRKKWRSSVFTNCHHSQSQIQPYSNRLQYHRTRCLVVLYFYFNHDLHCVLGAGDNHSTSCTHFGCSATCYECRYGQGKSFFSYFWYIFTIMHVHHYEWKKRIYPLFYFTTLSIHGSLTKIDSFLETNYILLFYNNNRLQYHYPK